MIATVEAILQLMNLDDLRVSEQEMELCCLAWSGPFASSETECTYPLKLVDEASKSAVGTTSLRATTAVLDAALNNEFGTSVEDAAVKAAFKAGSYGAGH